MGEIARIEGRIEMGSQGPLSSSVCPVKHRTFDPSLHCFVQQDPDPDSDLISNYLVSHYFDYIAGTSTGG